MSTELVTRAESQQMTVLSNDQLTYIAGTEFVPPGLRGNLPAILACVATGRALGIADMTSLRSIHVIDGKATFSAELMVMLARRAGHSITGKVTEGKAHVVGKRVDNGDEIEVEWTLAMADRAGLLGKSNWKKYPEAMLWARAVSQLCRELFADCFAGATYTTEELEDSVGGPQAGVEGGSPPPVSQTGEAALEESASPTEDPAAGTPFQYDIDAPVDPPGSKAGEPLSAAQAKKLNVLVGKLRPDHISTLQLWQSMGRIAEYDADGSLHWSPLRDSLSKDEASALIDRLETFAKVKLGEAA